MRSHKIDMDLTSKQLKSFQELYKKHFGKEISKEEAREQGEALVQFMKVTYRPIKKAVSYEKDN
jgi:hypothetical protein